MNDAAHDSTSRSQWRRVAACGVLMLLGRAMAAVTADV